MVRLGQGASTYQRKGGDRVENTSRFACSKLYYWPIRHVLGQEAGDKARITQHENRMNKP